ncbi:MAG: hypothetical protein AB7M12_05970 [Hyphomonadaceae bacterium]
MRIALLLLALVLTGCVSRPNLCQTARAIHADLDPNVVSIANVKRKWLTSSSTWEARTPQGLYLCRGDYMFGGVACGQGRAPSTPAPAIAPPSVAPPSGALTAPPAGGCG